MLNEMIIPRRKLLLGAGLSAFGLSQADAQTPFTTFAFAATGAPAERTMPDRLAEIKNVKDFGAVGNSSTPDDGAIQAAVNAAMAAGGGTIYFPPLSGFNNYKITNPITFNNANITLRFKGEGLASELAGAGFSGGGYILDRHLGSPNNTATIILENLNLAINDATVTGGVRLGSCNSITARDSSLVSMTTEDSAGNSSQNFSIDNCNFNGGGLVIGGTGAVTGCHFINCPVAIRAYGKGFFLAGNRTENNQTVYLLGLDSAGTDQHAQGFSILGSAEGNWLCIDFAGTCSGFNIGPMLIQGHDYTNSDPGLTISGYTYNSGNGLVTLTMAAVIPALLVSGINLGISGLNIAGLNGLFPCASASGTTVTYTGPTGQAGSPSNGGTLQLGSQYGIWVRANKASYGLFQEISTGANFDKAGLQVDASTNRSGILFLNGAFNQSGGLGVGFIGPSNAYTAQFQGCNPPDPIWTFSQLAAAGGSNVLEGEMFQISDSNTNTWGANVTASGASGHVLVRYNGTNYTVVAK